MDDILGIHGRALAIRSQRMSLLASNIANAATPGYKARDIDFAKALSLTEGGRDTAAAIKASGGFRVPLFPSLDGNSVELSTEQTLFAENALAYRATLSFLEGRINTLTRAWKGE